MTGKRKFFVILNGISLRRDYFYNKILPALDLVADVQVHETLSKNDAVSLASRAANGRYDLVIAAGGDGTLNQVLNGMLKGNEDTRLPAIGLIPLGSGNDFARTVGITDRVDQLVSLVQSFTTSKVDIGKIICSTTSALDCERYFINVADLGMGPMVVDKVMRSDRALGHAVAYYKSILSTFIDYKLMTVKAVSQDWSWQGKLRTMAIANGKYYGHGLCVAPDARVNDSLLDVFIAGDASVVDFIRFSSTLKAGKKVNLKQVAYKLTTAIELSSDKPCMIEGDGEILGHLPAKVSIANRQMDFLMPAQ